MRPLRPGPTSRGPFVGQQLLESPAPAFPRHLAFLAPAAVAFSFFAADSTPAPKNDTLHAFRAAPAPAVGHFALPTRQVRLIEKAPQPRPIDHAAAFAGVQRPAAIPAGQPWTTWPEAPASIAPHLAESTTRDLNHDALHVLRRVAPPAFGHFLLPGLQVRLIEKAWQPAKIDHDLRFEMFGRTTPAAPPSVQPWWTWSKAQRVDLTDELRRAADHNGLHALRGTASPAAPASGHFLLPVRQVRLIEKAWQPAKIDHDQRFEMFGRVAIGQAWQPLELWAGFTIVTTEDEYPQPRHSFQAFRQYIPAAPPSVQPWWIWQRAPRIDVATDAQRQAQPNLFAYRANVQASPQPWWLLTWRAPSQIERPIEFTAAKHDITMVIRHAQLVGTPDICRLYFAIKPEKRRFEAQYELKRFTVHIHDESKA
jgi:hypothetical protein